MSKLQLRRWMAIGMAVTATRVATATVYYVSPTGSDTNAGTSAASPWQSVTKVDDTSFSPGDQILFQYGGTWNGSLDATSSGTTAAPITYSTYGNAALGSPTFSGSDAVSPSAFSLVSGTTYEMTAKTPVNWVYDNNNFTRESNDATGSAVASTNLSFVESTPDSFFYNAGSSTLYVNLGSAPAGHTITLATRQDAIFNDYQSNLIFNGLATTQTAADNGGYGIRVQKGTNVSVSNASVSLAGKHGVGVIDSNNFDGNNLNTVGLAPDQGYGGASAYVSFSDVNTATINSGGDSATWSNLKFTNNNGAYGVFVTHGDTGAINSLNLSNIVSNNGYGSGIDIEPTSASEKVVINGGQLSGGVVAVGTNNSIVNGLHLNNGAYISLSGSHSVVQNTVVTNAVLDTQTGQNGAVVDDGTNNTIRFNTFDFSALEGPAVGSLNPVGATQIYGNVFDNPQEIGAEYDGTPTIVAKDNLYAYSGPPNYNATFALGDVNNLSYITSLAAWQALGFDAGSVLGDAVFNADYSLAAGSAGLGLYTAPLDPTLADANALLNPENPDGSFNAGVDYAIAVPEPVGAGLAALAVIGMVRRRRAR